MYNDFPIKVSVINDQIAMELPYACWRVRMSLKEAVVLKDMLVLEIENIEKILKDIKELE